jgi:hypothetical protein
MPSISVLAGVSRTPLESLPTEDEAGEPLRMHTTDPNKGRTGLLKLLTAANGGNLRHHPLFTDDTLWPKNDTHVIGLPGETLGKVVDRLKVDQRVLLKANGLTLSIMDATASRADLAACADAGVAPGTGVGPQPAAAGAAAEAGAGAAGTSAAGAAAGVGAGAATEVGGGATGAAAAAAIGGAAGGVGAAAGVGARARQKLTAEDRINPA